MRNKFSEALSLTGNINQVFHKPSFIIRELFE